MILMIITILLIIVAIVLHVISPITPWKSMAIKEMVGGSQPSCFSITIKLVKYAYYSQTFLIIFFLLCFFTLLYLLKKKGIITNIFIINASENNKSIIKANLGFFIGFNLILLASIFTELCAIYLIKIGQTVNSLSFFQMLISYVFIIIALVLNLFASLSLTILDVILKKLKKLFTPLIAGSIFLLALFIPFYFQYYQYNKVFGGEHSVGLGFYIPISRIKFENASDILYTLLANSSVQISIVIELILISILIIISLRELKGKFTKIIG